MQDADCNCSHCSRLTATRWRDPPLRDGSLLHCEIWWSVTQSWDLTGILIGYNAKVASVNVWLSKWHPQLSKFFLVGKNKSSYNWAVGTRLIQRTTDSCQICALFIEKFRFCPQLNSYPLLTVLCVALSAKTATLFPYYHFIFLRVPAEV